MDEMENLGKDFLPPYQLPSELRLGHFCDVQQREDSCRKKRQENDCVNIHFIRYRAPVIGSCILGKM